MNFFESQRKAQLNTRKLVVFLLLAVTSLLAITHVIFFFGLKYYDNSQTQVNNYAIPPYTFDSYLHSSIFMLVTLGILGVVLLGSLYKWFEMRMGGSAIAEHLGGTPISVNTNDFLEKRLLNVVQEMAIASGSPVPPVYILEDQAINAFAAGHTPADAVIGITRGTLEQLNREQLQGVIAHEFSHIFHGDSKINLNIIAILHGILLLGLIGYFILRSAGYSRSKNAGALLAIGFGLVVLGYGGVFFGNIIKASVSRQREYLADASAVQYTRNPQGIAGALKVIGHSSFGAGIMENAHVDEVTHMLFAEGRHFFMHMWATHPPLEKRIRAVEPNWDGKYLAPRNQNQATSAEDLKNDASAQQQSRQAHRQEQVQAILTSAAVLGAVETIGLVDSEHVGYAQDIIANIPDTIVSEMATTNGAQQVLLAMVLAQSDAKNVDAATRDQIQQLQKKYSTLIQSLKDCPDELRLPIVDISIASMKHGTKEDYLAFMPLLELYVNMDGKINLFEWCLRRMVQNQLASFFTGPPTVLNHKSIASVMEDVSVVLSLLVQMDSSNDAENIIAQTRSQFNLTGLAYIPPDLLKADMFDKAVDRISKLKPLQKPTVIKACAFVISFDNKIKINEVETLRALASTWNCPMPPVMV